MFTMQNYSDFIRPMGYYCGLSQFRPLQSCIVLLSSEIKLTESLKWDSKWDNRLITYTDSELRMGSENAVWSEYWCGSYYPGTLLSFIGI